MTYLRIRNFWNYQNSDVWKKSHARGGHPPWFKHYVHRDMDLDELSIEARLLWWELLAIATKYQNVLKDDVKWISSESKLDLKVVRRGLAELRKGAWLSETTSERKSRRQSKRDLNAISSSPEDTPHDTRQELSTRRKPASPKGNLHSQHSRQPSRQKSRLEEEVERHKSLLAKGNSVASVDDPSPVGGSVVAAINELQRLAEQKGATDTARNMTNMHSTTRSETCG